jgi:phosphomannomutase
MGSTVSGTRIASVSGLRGIVGDGLGPDDIVRFAAAYAAECGPGPIYVGHDGRRTAPLLRHAVFAGLTGSGRQVLDLGPAATPTVGVMVASGGAAGGVQISASHNPPEYNGLKFFQPGGMVLGPAAGRAVVDRFERGDFSWAPYDQLGQVSEIDPFMVDDEHLHRILPLVDVPAIAAARPKVVVDSGHGAGGRLAERLLVFLGCQVRPLGSAPDGLYEHPPEPTEENLRELAAIVPAVGAAVGFAQDPDADRLAIIDEKGRYIGEELTLALAVRHRLAREKGPIVLNMSTSRVAEDLARQAGVPVVRTPVGEIHVVEAMKANGAVLGGEGNGGVIDPKVGFVRDSFVGMALVLDLMVSERKPLSVLVDELPRYVLVKTKFPLGNLAVAEVLQRIEAAYPEAAADRRDGLRLDWPDGWAQVRASNTEPIVRVFAEAADADRAQSRAEALGRLVGEMSGGAAAR